MLVKEHAKPVNNEPGTKTKKYFTVKGLNSLMSRQTPPFLLSPNLTYKHIANFQQQNNKQSNHCVLNMKFMEDFKINWFSLFLNLVKLKIRIAETRISSECCVRFSQLFSRKRFSRKISQSKLKQDRKN